MRRDYFEVESNAVEEGTDERPAIVIEYDGPDGMLADRLTADDGTLDASELDVTYRTTPAGGSDGQSGVLSITNRITGDFVLEANVDPESIESVVSAATETDDTSYRIRITDSEGKSTIYGKELLLVYDESGSLRRSESLIPGGVEL
ncbi:hypothetical protein BRC91_07500 [Halobacteriales archaeon QS_4_62_28]|nr:MAG: hypothetical protein BRC91_07500 [Halobacteriales archaeon QS_4_62_28]